MNKQDTPTTATSTTTDAMPSRRTVLGAGGAVGLTLLNPGSIFAQGADGANTIRVGFISPRTGALASFGEADGYVLELARKALAGGITAGGKKYAVEILDRDTQSDPGRASQLAKTLINVDKVDLVLVTSAPETVNPVADACEGAGVPCLSTVTPWEAWYFGRGAKPGAPSPFKWTFHFSFGVGEFVKCYTSQWGQLTTNKKVAALYPNDADGNAIRASLAPALQKAGFTIVDAGPYETGTTDFSAQIAKF
jgi:branched-chain amino acid transport system substrate-binding protein